jgi:hypothetical protein
VVVSGWDGGAKSSFQEDIISINLTIKALSLRAHYSDVARIASDAAQNAALAQRAKNWQAVRLDPTIRLYQWHLSKK